MEGMKIIVAEDDPGMRDLVVTTLREDAHDVEVVPDGGRLLVLLARYAREELPMPDVIVSDIRMPVMTGLGMLKGLRDAHWHIPVILMTAFPDPQTKLHAESLDARVLTKPFPLEALREAVRRSAR